MSIRLRLPRFFEHSTPKFKVHHRKRAYETTPNKPSETDPVKTINDNIRYFKLPFIGKFSKFTENKLQKEVL